MRCATRYASRFIYAKHHLARRCCACPFTFGELLADTVAGKLDASAVIDLTVDLDGVPRGYAAMDSREAIEVMVRP